MVRERRPPFSPDAVVKEFAELLKVYGIRTIYGDRYAGMWPRERFAVHGINYIVADEAKSDIYCDLLPILNSGRAELLDHPRLVAQLCGLERRVSRGGRDSIDHIPGAHDDVANCVAGALVAAARRVKPEVKIVMPFYHGVRRNVPGGAPLQDTGGGSGNWQDYLARDPGRWG